MHIEESQAIVFDEIKETIKQLQNNGEKDRAFLLLNAMTTINSFIEYAIMMNEIHRTVKLMNMLPTLSDR